MAELKLWTPKNLRRLLNPAHEGDREELIEALDEIQNLRRRIKSLEAQHFKTLMQCEQLIAQKDILIMHLNDYKRKYETLE